MADPQPDWEQVPLPARAQWWGVAEPGDDGNPHPGVQLVGGVIHYHRLRKGALNPLAEQYGKEGRGRRVLEALTAIPTGSPMSVNPFDVAADGPATLGFVRTYGPILAGAHIGSRPGPLDVLATIGQQVAILREHVEIADALSRGEVISQPVARRTGASARSLQELRAALAHSMGIQMPVLEVGTGDDGRFGYVLNFKSLIEVAYWQLFQQLIRRPRGPAARQYQGRPDPVFGLPWCGYCGGAILSTRLAGDKVNKWHAGCKDAGQARQRRSRT